jgi:hypothetical protein
MSLLCLAAAGAIVALPLQAFTLAWTHSIEKIRWEEDYRIVGRQLQVTEARIRGSGAGMEPPAGAVLKDGVWHYVPQIAPQTRVRLARSPYTADYTLCWEGKCHPMADVMGPVEQAPQVDMTVCGE